MPQFTPEIWWALLLAISIFMLLCGIFVFGLLVYQRRLIRTQREKMEAIRQREQEYSDLFNNVTDLVFIHSATGEVTKVNDAVKRLLDYSPEEVIGRPFQRLAYPAFDFENNYLDSVNRDEESSGRLTLRTRSGEPRIFEFRNSVYEKAEQKRQVRGIARDVTEQVLAEQNLRDSEERYRRLTDFSPLAIAVQVDGRLVYLNQAGLKLSDTESPQALLEKRTMSFIPRKERTILCQEIRENLKEGKDIFASATKFRSISGVEKDVEIVSMPMIYDGNKAVQIVIRDVTEQNRLQQELARAQHLETAGKLAGQIAHDFNNLLAPLTAYPSLIREDLPEDHEVLPMVNFMEAAAEKIAEINQQLLALGRRGNYTMEIMNLSEMITRLLQTGIFTKGIEVKEEHQQDVRYIKAGGAQLTRAFTNLLTNAVDAMGGSGTLTVSTRNIKSTEINIPRADIKPGDYVRLNISDTGSGIAPDVLERIFDPFFSTKSMDKMRGSGLGLSIVHGIIEDHDGYIWVDSEVGKGTTFSLFFPAADIEEEEIQTVDDMPGGNGEKILIVDDDPIQRQVADKFLSRLGYEVIVTSNGEEAIQVAKAIPVDLLILDLVLGELDGTETFKRIRKVSPDQKALMMSGYVATDSVDEALRLGVKEFIQKPIIPKLFATVVRRVLDDEQ